MARVKIHTPVEGYTGTVAGVDFDKGVGECDTSDAQAIAYFARHGYGIGEPAKPVTGADKLAAPTHEHVGTHLVDGGALDSDGGTDDGSRSEAQSEDRTPHIKAFLDRKADEVIADVPSLTDDDRALALTVEQSGKARVTVLRALGGEG